MKILYLLLLFLFTAITANAADTDPWDKPHFNDIGAVIGYGFNENTDETYQPVTFMGNFAINLEETNYHKPIRGMFMLYLEPQLNYVITDAPVDIEFGVNLGLKYNVTIYNKVVLYAMGGLGPHYISAEIERQVNGFIFSDNFALGMAYILDWDSKVALTLQYRFRHMSNGGIRTPNRGINNRLILAGITRYIL